MSHTPHNHLDQGLADEAAIRKQIEAGAGPGLATTEQIAGKSGLQIMKGVLHGELPYAHLAKTLDFTMVQAEKGLVVFQGTPAIEHFNPLGSVHGGWFATLLDSALGCAIHTMMPVGRAYTTAELSINFVRAITLKVPRVRAEGRVIHCGRQLATAEARLVGPDGTLYAHGTTTCLVFDLKHPPAAGATT